MKGAPLLPGCALLGVTSLLLILLSPVAPRGDCGVFLFPLPLRRQLMGTPAGLCKDRLFLCRNVGRSRGTPADEDGSLLDTFAQVAINNGLECKVACSNSKVRTACVL